jgi:hypothetical protein
LETIKQEVDDYDEIDISFGLSDSPNNPDNSESSQ